MNLHKLFNLHTIKQSIALQDEVKTIMKRCEVIATQEHKEQKENQRTHDNRCPKCRAAQDEIVDKIASVEGEGRVNGNLYLGFGNINGFGSVDTNPVNHCNHCGHEWKKFKTKYISKTDIIRVTLQYLAQIIENPVHNKTMSWKTEAVEVFDGCHAEAIFIIYQKHKSFLRQRTSTYLKLRDIRVNYISIYNK